MIPPIRHFKPRHMIMPLDMSFAETSPSLAAFIKKRLELGDPGPLHLDDGEYYTPMSLEESASEGT